jgi:hypothetical protein
LTAVGDAVTASQLVDAFAAAATGPVLQGQLFPVSDAGCVRVTYNWLYSSLNCDPSDTSEFEWTLTKLSETTVSLSPTVQYEGITLFASVRPDNGYNVEVQAPNSAEWITQVGADETLGVDFLGFMTISLQGLNGLYVAVNSGLTSHDGYAAYQIQSTAGASGPATNFFVGTSQVVQAGLDVPLLAELSPADLKAAGAPPAAIPSRERNPPR